MKHVVLHIFTITKLAKCKLFQLLCFKMLDIFRKAYQEYNLRYFCSDKNGLSVRNISSILKYELEPPSDILLKGKVSWIRTS